MNREFCLGNAMVARAEDGFAVRENLDSPKCPVGYDLDLLYVECRYCGKPVLWERGQTSVLVNASGIDTTLLDAECLILSDGCPQCRPESALFHLQMVRVTALSPQDILLLADTKGSA